MSTCKKCDRCGEHYAKGFDNRKLGKLYDNGSTTKNEWDLCPDCWELFDSWIANDDSTPKNDVNDAEVDANDADAASAEDSAGAVFVDGVQVFPPKALEHVKDSREKLEEDCEKLIRSIQRRTFSGRDAGALRYQLKELLDRQAAITRAEFDKPGWEYCETCEEIARLRVESMNLAHDLGECMADRDRYRALCGQMLDAAHEIRRIADANMPEVAKEVLK